MNRYIARGPAERLAGGGRSVRVAVCVSLAALLGPSLAARVPPLSDYPNHLARMFLVGGGALEPPLSAMYRVAWDTMTNIGIDLFAAVLAPWLGYDVVGRLLVALAVMLPPLGGALLWARLHGGFHWWQLAFGSLAWCFGLLLGLLNFEIGLGLALVAAAVEPYPMRRGPWSVAAVRAVLGVVVMLVHVFALAFYASLLAGIAFGPRFGDVWRPGARAAAVKRVLLAISAAMLPAMATMALSARLPGSQAGASSYSLMAEFGMGFDGLQKWPAGKLLLAMSGLRTYDGRLDLITGVALFAPVVLALATRRLAVHAGLLMAGLGLSALFVLFPPELAGAGQVDIRFALMATLAFAVAVRPMGSPGMGLVFGAVLLTVCLARTGTIGWVWYIRQADVASMARAVSDVPPGAAVLAVEHRPIRGTVLPIGRAIGLIRHRSFDHLHALAVPWRHAFVPTLFAAKGKHPLRVLPPWDALSQPDGGMLPGVAVLTDSALSAEGSTALPYLAVWRTRFDFVLVLNADIPDEHGPFLPPPGLLLVRDEGFAQLWRIVPVR